ncbi:MAG: aldehyde dehydrogenase family protein [Candidatus Riflebacteria bacterium]|nr:aldehyde dehydrogenase family protein [Candidatus Riflebacteria bacterium]
MTRSSAMKQILKQFPFNIPFLGGFSETWFGSGPEIAINTPVDGRALPSVKTITIGELDKIFTLSQTAFHFWREVPAPERGQIVREFSERIRRYKNPLAQIITLEMGKPMRESLGEVQEVIDICDYAVGLSRQIGGPVLPSERRSHRMFEQWHPLGPIAVITAFNFPMAVWAWNAAIGLTCGNSIIWKPSSKALFSAIVCTLIMEQVLKNREFPASICSLAIGRGSEIGDSFGTDQRIPLVSYTGSTKIGRILGKAVQERFGRLILELGGNNAVIVSQNANLEIALGSIFFGALGTAGQRCTSTRRVVVHEQIYNLFLSRLVDIFSKAKIGDPFEPENFMGPLVDQAAASAMLNAMEKVRKDGGKIIFGGELLPLPGGCYISPAIAEVPGNIPIVAEETFAPLLYVMKYHNLEEAINLQNSVPQGLSSAIITNDLQESERFLSATGSDCGIANVNTGTNGAEIGGAFGGEKATGGGRESGSDSWKSYMRRQTCTINYSGTLELAQGIKLDFLK